MSFWKDISNSNSNSSISRSSSSRSSSRSSSSRSSSSRSSSSRSSSRSSSSRSLSRTRSRSRSRSRSASRSSSRSRSASRSSIRSRSASRSSSRSASRSSIRSRSASRSSSRSASRSSSRSRSSSDRSYGNNIREELTNDRGYAIDTLDPFFRNIGLFTYNNQESSNSPINQKCNPNTFWGSKKTICGSNACVTKPFSFANKKKYLTRQELINLNEKPDEWTDDGRYWEARKTEIENEKKRFELATKNGIGPNLKQHSFKKCLNVITPDDQHCFYYKDQIGTRTKQYPGYFKDSRKTECRGAHNQKDHCVVSKELFDLSIDIKHNWKRSSKDGTADKNLIHMVELESEMIVGPTLMDLYILLEEVCQQMLSQKEDVSSVVKKPHRSNRRSLKRNKSPSKSKVKRQT